MTYLCTDQFDVVEGHLSTKHWASTPLFKLKIKGGLPIFPAF